MIRVWVDGRGWREVESLAGAGPDDHVFTVDRDAGRIVFGDGLHGQRPPLGAEAVAAVYEHGRGRSGHDTDGDPPLRATGPDVRDRTDLAVWTVIRSDPPTIPFPGDPCRRRVKRETTSPGTTRPLVNRPRALEPAEIAALLRADVPARLATIDRDGFPHVTPLWFIWEDDAFHLTSFSDRPHLRRLRHDPRAGICVDIEQPERDDGQRPNQQVRAVGRAELFPDADGVWTRRITARYVQEAVAGGRATGSRTVIRLRPSRLVAVASV